MKKHTSLQDCNFTAYIPEVYAIKLFTAIINIEAWEAYYAMELITAVKSFINLSSVGPVL